MSDSLACLKSGSSGASITMTSDWYLLLQAVDEHAACMKKLMTLTRGKPAGQGGYLPGGCKELVLPFIVSGMLLIKPSRRAPGDRAVTEEALPDTGGSVSKTLHRVDPNLVLEEVQLAGFGLMQSSDLLQNLQDDHNLNVFDPAIRGRTDRFVFIFRKPP